MTEHDLWKECLDADNCEIINEFLKLIDMMLKDIQSLEVLCVRARYEISKYLESPYDEYLKSDILSGLSRSYNDNPAYHYYIQEIYDGGDPMSFKEWLDTIHDAARGKDSSDF